MFLDVPFFCCDFCTNCRMESTLLKLHQFISLFLVKQIKVQLLMVKVSICYCIGVGVIVAAMFSMDFIELN